MLPYVVVNSSRLIFYIYNLHLHMLGKWEERVQMILHDQTVPQMHKFDLHVSSQSHGFILCFAERPTAMELDRFQIQGLFHCLSFVIKIQSTVLNNFPT